jgi:hypothetical protein
MTFPRVIVTLMLASSLSAWAAQPPALRQLVTYQFDYRGRYLTQREADQIVSFVNTVPAVDHRVRLISVKSPDDVEVHTGPGLRNPAGNTLHLRKHHGAWSVFGKSQGSGF